MHSDETITAHSQNTSVFSYTAPASQSEETATTYSDETAATYIPITPTTSVETDSTKDDDTKDDDMKGDDMKGDDMKDDDMKDDASISSLSDMSDTELEKLSVVMEHAERYYTNPKPGKPSQPPNLTKHHQLLARPRSYRKHTHHPKATKLGLSQEDHRRWRGLRARFRRRVGRRRPACGCQ